MRSISAHEFCRTLIGILGAAALALGCWQILVRYVLPGIGSIWVDEVVIYLFAWATFIGVALLVYKDQHVRADVVIRLLPVPAQRALEVGHAVLGSSFCAAIAWFSYLVTLDAYLIDERSVTGSAIPIWIFYACLPAGMALTAFWYLRRLFLLVFHFDHRDFSVRSGHEA